jgi:hypothetical protein
MRRIFCCVVVGFCACCSGCEILELTVCNLGYEAWLEKECAVTCVRNRKLAEQAWVESLCSHPTQVHSVDYDRGFKDGYASYLDANGHPLPPALPPKHYWSARYQTPEGHRAIDDWYLGYQHGAQAAQASGQRELITVPTPGHPAAPRPVESLFEVPGPLDKLPMPQPLSAYPTALPPVAQTPAAKGM